MYEGASSGITVGATRVPVAPEIARVKRTPSAGSDLQGNRFPQNVGQRNVEPSFVRPWRPVCASNV
jgi:hypothetical protein